MRVAVEATHIAQFAVAAVYFGLALWLLYLDFSRTIHRILALLLFLRGSIISLNQLVSVDPSNADFWHGSRLYFFIAAAFATLDFLIVYTWRKSTPARRGARRFSIGLFVMTELVYALDHSLVSIRAEGTLRFGALGVFSPLHVVMLGVAAFWFAWLSRSTTIPAQARFHGLFALGFAVAALAEAAGPLAFLVLNGIRPLLIAGGTAPGAVSAQVISLLTIPLSIAAVVILLSESLKQGNISRAWWQAAVGVAVVALPLLTRIIAGDSSHSYLFFSAVPRVFGPALLTYALVRQLGTSGDIFRLDLRAGMALRKGTVGGVLIAFFFIVSESAAQFFSQFAATQNLDPIVAQILGIVGAGILLVFLHPLNRLGERLSTSVLPHAKPLNDLGNRERLRIYKEQVELAWADGSITRKERLLLDKLREQLNLQISDTVTLESRAAERAPV